jgi:succinate dehydrogenase / fumarate reductase flavoprotein subunit
MQGLADGYFVIPYTIGDYLAGASLEPVDVEHPAFRAVEEEVARRTAKLLAVRGRRTVDSFHRELGKLMWDNCGMARSADGLRTNLRRIPELRQEFWEQVNVPGSGEELNQALEKAGRVADFLEFAELLCLDALHREESCGGHFRVEHQTADGEARRDDDRFCYVAAWAYQGPEREPALHKEPLEFENVHLSTRSYK